MKISFNETSLQTMFEYPSESSLAEEEEEEEEGHASETEEDKSCTFYIPRPNSTLHPNTPNSGEPRRCGGTLGFLVVSDTVSVSCSPSWGSTQVEMLVEVTAAS